MRKIVVVLLALTIVLSCLISCSEKSASDECILTIGINSDVSRGLQSISMDTAKYHVVVKDASNNVILNETSNATKTSYSVSVITGTYTAVVEALNKDDVVIGTGSQTKAIKLKDNSMAITVFEIAGKGLFDVSIASESGAHQLLLEILDSNLETVDTTELVFAAGHYSASVELDNGFYYFKITDVDDSFAVVYQAMRIVASQTTTFTESYSFREYDLTMAIQNTVIGDNTISIDIIKNVYSAEESLNAKATTPVAEGQFRWAIDNDFPTDSWLNDSTVSIDLSSLQLELGEHLLTVFFRSSSGILLSTSVSFEMSNTRIYVIGETGPAGGYVFYDCDADNESGNADGLVSSNCGWRYLEAAPEDISIGGQTTFIAGYYRESADGENQWLNGTTVFEDKDDYSIGTGMANTELIVQTRGSAAYTQETGSETTDMYAAKVCLDYVCNGFDDWFLPSHDEQRALFQFFRAKDLSDMSEGRYWNSSEDGGQHPGWFGMMYAGLEGQQFGGSGNDAMKVRAIRSF